MFTGQVTAALLGITMIGALVAFLIFNWFPAKIFGGDSLTLMIGANLAIMSVIGNMEAAGVLLMALFLVEFLIKATHKFQSECFGIPDKKGRLHANPKGGSLTQWIMKLGGGKLTEIKVTLTVLALQVLVAIATLSYFLLTFH